MSKRSSLRNRKVISSCWHFAATTPAKVMAAILCLVLLFFSFMLVVMQVSAVQASNRVAQLAATPTSSVDGTPSPTFTATPSPTSSATASPTPSPTFTATPSPTPTRTPRPTRTPKPSPTPIPTATATASATATGTAQPTATLQPTTTRNPNATQTAGSVPPTQTTGNGGGTGLPPSAPTPPTTQGSGGGGSFLRPVMIGLVAILAIAGICFLGFVVLRRRMLPADPLKTNLPPSGARPWSRFRQGSMHGNTNVYNVYNDQTLATIAPPFSAATSWVVRRDGPAQNMNFAQSQSMPTMQGTPNMPANVPPDSNPLSSQSYPPAQLPFPAPGLPAQGSVAPQSQPYPQIPPDGDFPQPQPYPPYSPYPQSPPNGGYSAAEPLLPQLPFPQQQGFPFAQPNAGFYPANMGNNDIALAFDSASTPSTGVGNVAPHSPSPAQLPGMNRLDGMDSSRTGDIPGIPGVPGVPGIPDTPRLGPETNSEEFPSLDDPFLRDTLKHYMQRGKGAQEGEKWEET